MLKKAVQAFFNGENKKREKYGGNRGASITTRVKRFPFLFLAGESTAFPGRELCILKILCFYCPRLRRGIKATFGSQGSTKRHVMIASKNRFIAI
jgi:hypothetical protein